MLLLRACPRPSAPLEVLREGSGGTRPLRRFQVSSQRASSATSSGSQLSRPGGCAVGSAGLPNPGGAPGPRNPGNLLPVGPTVGQGRVLLGLTHCLPRHCSSCLHQPAAAPRGRGGGLPLLPHRGRRLAGLRGGAGLAWLRGGCQGDRRAFPWRMWEAASLSSSGAAVCTPWHATFTIIAPLV